MKNKDTSYTVLGLCVGTALGIVFDNLAVGASIGLAIGIGLDGCKSKKQSENGKN